MAGRYTQRTTRHRRARVPLAPRGSELDLQLRALATVLEQAAEDAGWGADPKLVFQSPVDRAGGSFDLGMKAIEDGASVIEQLRGFCAPANWHMLGVIAEGNASHVDDGSARPTGPAGRARVVHLVHRSGASVSVLRQPDAEPVVVSDPPAGRVDDYCRRALRIGCAPPQSSTLELWSAIWLDGLLDEVPESWPRAAELHPAVRMLRIDADACRNLSPADDLVAIGEALARVAPWERLRTDCASGRWSFQDFPRTLAAWLDEGSFSREVLGTLPTWKELANAVADVLPLPVGERVADTLSRWDLT